MTPAEAERREELLAVAASRPLTGDETIEIGTLETRHHAFGLMCTRTAPLNPMALGYAWDERLEHSAAPHMAVRVRTGGLVEMDGETITLMNATRRVASVAKRGIALADWSGPTGRLGGIAGLEHPPREQPSTMKPERATTVRTEPARSAVIADLFD